MTVKELKEILDKYPDDMLVGNVDHFGEFMEDVEVYECSAYIQPEGFNRLTHRVDLTNRVKVLKILLEDPGEEPD